MPPALGRVFTAADDRRGCGSPGVVISYAFWQREFGGQASAIGKKLHARRTSVRGDWRTPGGFFGIEVGKSFDVAAPICSEAAVKGEYSRLERRDGWWLASVARLKPGLTVARASAQLPPISPAVFEATVPPMYRPDRVK